MTQSVHADSGLVHIPVSEAGLCVTHWASRSRFAANDILLACSTACWGDFQEHPCCLAFIRSWHGFFLENQYTLEQCQVDARHVRANNKKNNNVKKKYWMINLSINNPCENEAAVRNRTVQICISNRGLGRWSQPQQGTVFCQEQKGEKINKYTTPSGTTCSADTNSSRVTPSAFTSQFIRRWEARKQSDVPDTSAQRWGSVCHHPSSAGERPKRA